MKRKLFLSLFLLIAILFAAGQEAMESAEGQKVRDCELISQIGALAMEGRIDKIHYSLPESLSDEAKEAYAAMSAKAYDYRLVYGLTREEQVHRFKEMVKKECMSDR